MAGFQQAWPAGYHCPRFQELPSIPLYKDQVVEELNRYLAPLHCGEITATMVNNYVKVKAIPPPEKKRYGRAQLAGLYLICLLKQVYSLGEITAMLRVAEEPEDFPARYDTFCTELEEVFRSVFDGQTPPRDGQALTVTRAAAYTLAYKLYARRLLRQAVRQRARALEQAEAASQRAKKEERKTGG
ncbi:MAG: DUF1836 domain-containing protein [Clostridiales bacterium]|nr:DUF1836 domain-containing protein [Clostridiales bacterium]